MNDNLFELIKITRKYNHRSSLLTNGLKLGQEDYVIKLKNWFKYVRIKHERWFR